MGVLDGDHIRAKVKFGGLTVRVACPLSETLVKALVAQAASRIAAAALVAMMASIDLALDERPS